MLKIIREGKPIKGVVLDGECIECGCKIETLATDPNVKPNYAGLTTRLHVKCPMAFCDAQIPLGIKDGNRCATTRNCR